MERRAECKERTGNGNGFGLTVGMAVQLLPTPSALESTPTEEYVEEARQAGIDPNERLYLPGRKWHSQRTLSRIAPALLPTPTTDDANNNTRDSGEFQSLVREINNLPTPSARDGKGVSARNPLRSDNGQPRSDAERPLSDVAKLLPTPTSAVDSGSRNLPGSKAHMGVSLTDAVKSGNSTTPRRPTGVSSEEQSSDGSSSSEDEHLVQLTIEDA